MTVKNTNIPFTYFNVISQGGSYNVIREILPISLEIKNYRKMLICRNNLKD